MSAASSSSAVKHREKKAAQAPYYFLNFYKIPPNPCQHYYWEDGPDNYLDFLVRGGYVSPGLSSFDSAGVIASEETEVQVKKQSTVETVVYAEAMQKMNELIFLCRSILTLNLRLPLIPLLNPGDLGLSTGGSSGVPLT